VRIENPRQPEALRLLCALDVDSVDPLSVYMEKATA
jgi:hypothetical protein